MANSELDNSRKLAWIKAKEAVRAYARNPTVNAAEKVEACWRAIRNGDSGDGWRESDWCNLLKYQPRKNSIVRLAERQGKSAFGTANMPDTVDLPWPVNDIVMRSLLLKGMGDAEIAAMYHVSKEIVRRRRQSLDI